MTSRAIFPSTPITMPSAAASSALRVRSVCHGIDRLGQPESLRESVHDADTGLAQCSQRARCAAQLHRKALASDMSEQLACFIDRHKPARSLEPEGRGNRRLQQGARRHQRVAMGRGERRARAGRVPQVREDEVDRSLRDE